MSKKTKNEFDDELHRSILEVMEGRFGELQRYNRNLLGKLEAQLESNAYQVLKAAAKEIEAVSRKHAERVREKSSKESREEEGQVQVRIPPVAVLSPGHEASLYPGFHITVRDNRGDEGEVRQGQPQEDGPSSGATQGQGHSDAVHAGQSDQQGQQD